MLTFKLRTKILFPAAGVILVVVFASLAIINYLVRRQVLNTMSQDLARGRQVFHELQERQLELLAERSLVVAETPYLKAAVETGDARTVQGVAEQVYDLVRSDLFIITDREGRVLAQVGEAPRIGLKFTPDSLQLRGAFAMTEAGLLAVAARYYGVVLVPIVSGNPVSGANLLGMAASGNRIDRAYLEHFRALTNSEIAFIAGDKILVTTLPALQRYRQWKWQKTFSVGATLNLGANEYIVSLPGATELPGGGYVLLRSVREVLAALLDPIERTIFGIAVLSIILAIGLSYVMAQSVALPVQRLVRATDAVSAGDYDQAIAVNTKDEIGHLAGKFDEMRQSLKRQMAQLAQRNTELEAALHQLERAQKELVQTEKLAATGKITAQLSHELNNPIHNIRSCLESAQKKIAAENPARELLDLAYEEALRMSKLLREMLDFYRPRPAERAPVAVAQIVQEIIKSSSATLQQHEVRSTWEVPEALPPVLGSRDQLKQVFLNLVLNAIDAMPGGGELAISGYAQNGWVYFSIADTGVGIPPENLDRIFDAFFTTKNKASGVGLGLSVSYGIVRDHGGRIQIESKPEHGSKFTVKLPAAEGK